MSRRLISLGVLLAVVMAACSTLDPEALAFAEEGSRQDQTILRIATYTTDGFIEAIGEWEREHPTVNVVVDFRPIDEHHRQVLEPLVDTLAPDIIAIEASYMPTFRNMTSLLEDLSTQTSSPLFPDFLDWRLEQGRSDDGTLRALPVDVGGLALVYRSDLVDAAPNSEARTPTEVASWCDLIAIGADYSARTKSSFLAGSADLFEAVLMQSDEVFHDADGRLIYESNPAVRQAWDIAMRALAEEPLFADPCSSNENSTRITAGLNSISDDWNMGLRDRDFAAVLAPASLLDRIQNTVPESSGSWRVVPVPNIAGSVGGTHLAVLAATEHPDLARDLVAYLTADVTQRSIFHSTGRLPATTSDEVLIDEGSAALFFADSAVTQTYADSVNAYVPAPDGPNFRLILREFRTGITRVEAGDLSPDESWTETLWRLDQILG